VRKGEKERKKNWNLFFSCQLFVHLGRQQCTPLYQDKRKSNSQSVSCRAFN